MLQTPPSASLTVFTTLLSGVLSGIVVATLSYLLTRRKTNAEIRKLQIEAEKISLETEKLRKELSGNVETLASATYQLTNALERTVYDSSQRDIGFDFKGNEGYLYEKNVRVTPKGMGILSCEQKVLNLQRTNTDGRFEISLRSYRFGATETEDIPRNDLISGRRRFRITFEAKVIGGKHTLKFVFKGLETGKWLGQADREIDGDSWQPYTVHVLVSPKESCRLRIDDQDVERSPSSIQIRKFVLTERVSEDA